MAAAATEIKPTSQVGQFLDKPKKHLIGGKWVDAASRKWLKAIPPTLTRL
jgi:hypothetical protein